MNTSRLSRAFWIYVCAISVFSITAGLMIASGKGVSISRWVVENDIPGRYEAGAFLTGIGLYGVIAGFRALRKS